MTKMTKRFVAGMLSSAFVLSLGMSAFAADATLDGSTWTNDVTVTVTTEVPTISVTLPTTADITINPYKMEVTLEDDSTSSASIISPEYTITNASDCGVKITATASATAGGDAVIATAALKGTESTKSIFLYIDAAYEGTAYGGAYNAKAVNQLAITTKAASKTIMELAAGADTATEGTYMIKGDAASAPETPWAATDTATVTLSFKVDPVAIAPASGT
jgi:hypothetical protein